MTAGDTRRVCGWCEGDIPAGARRDSRYCGQRCRQAAHRFHRDATRTIVAGEPLRLAYADPPYPGKARTYYADHPDYAGEVDHHELIGRLAADYPDGWALSTTAAALQPLLAIATELDVDVRVAAWVRGERPGPSNRPLSSWEPVLVHGGRPIRRETGDRVVDSLVHGARARRTDRRHVTGAKPARFVWWLFDLLGAVPGLDDLDDLYPGSMGVSRAWEHASRCAAADGSRVTWEEVELAFPDLAAQLAGEPSRDVEHDGTAVAS